MDEKEEKGDFTVETLLDYVVKNKMLQKAVDTLAEELFCLRENQKELCDTCRNNGLSKRGKCYIKRMNTDGNKIASTALSLLRKKKELND